MAENLGHLGYLLGLTAFFLASLSSQSEGGFLNSDGRLYGPTSPSGYVVRVSPGTLTTAHSQPAEITVSVENAAGQPVDDVLVQFLPSEGRIDAGSSQTRGGVITGTFRVGTGSDSPRTAFIMVIVENVDITVFVDIVPSVYGR